VGDAASGGTWSIKFLNDKDFNLYYPNGAKVSGQGKIGTKFTGGGMEFKIEAGSDATQAGDEAILTVTPIARSYVEYTGAAGQLAEAVLYSQLPEATGATPAVAFVRDCEVKRGSLAMITPAAEKQLAKSGIIVRDAEMVNGVHSPKL